jgi:predicted Rossmann-fold nucleotide-binding protein
MPGSQDGSAFRRVRRAARRHRDYRGIFRGVDVGAVGDTPQTMRIAQVGHYYDKLIEFIDHVVGQEFLEPMYKNMIQVDDDPGSLLTKFKLYEAPRADKVLWVLKKKGNVVK